MSQHPIGRDERFRRLYAEHFDALLGYALRRVDRSEDAADIVADEMAAGTLATLVRERSDC